MHWCHHDLILVILLQMIYPYPRTLAMLDYCCRISFQFCVEQLTYVDACAGGLFLPETPNSLVERGYLSEAKNVLQKVRGTKDVDVEFDTIVLANEALKGMENPWRAIFRRRNRPQLILAIAMPFFQ